MKKSGLAVFLSLCFAAGLFFKTRTGISSWDRINRWKTSGWTITVPAISSEKGGRW